MTRFTVVWAAEAISELARIWTEADDREAISAAAAFIDVVLADNPHEKGISLREGLRKLASPPLSAIYCVHLDDRIADVSAIRILARSTAMNYFAHGRLFIDDPYFLAGTAVPDWLNVSDRRVRVRSKHALLWVDDPDPRTAAVARGIARHHADDRWFHETAAFAELCWHFTVRIRDLLEPEDGLRPSFLGHILVEILLDSVLTDQNPGMLEAYYQAVACVDGPLVQAAVNQMGPGNSQRLGEFIGLFVREQFLWDYAQDGKLWFRLNQVMRRVGLASLPENFLTLLPEARSLVAERAAELLAPPAAAVEPMSGQNLSIVEKKP